MALKETYYEQFLKGKPDFKLHLALALDVLFIAVCLFLVFTNRGGILFLLFAAIGVLVYKVLSGYTHKIYEYIMYNSELDIAVIHNKKKREECASIDVNNAELVAYKGSDRILQYEIEVVQDYTSGKKGRQVYGIVIELEKRMNCIYIEPDEDILNAIIKYSDRKFIG